MLAIVTAIFLTLAGSTIYHLIPQANLRLRMSWVASLSFVIVFAHYPVAALFATGAGVFAWLLALLGRRYPAIEKYGPFSLIGLLMVFSIEDIYVDTDIYNKTLMQFGMSFYILRLYLVLRTGATRAQVVRLEEFLVVALFFPIFPAGPICAQEAFTRSSLLNRPLLHNYLLGMLRIGIGIFVLYFVTSAISDITASLITVKPGYLTDWQNMSWLDTYLVMLLRFLHLYANFAGYTEIAIGLGLFFGFKIPENFKYPFLATNIQNFWQRWHLSLSNFITTQIYLPLMLTLRKPRLSLFLAFAMVGMWHQVSTQYLVWGIGHGAMLVAYMTLKGTSFHTTLVSRLNTRVWTAVSWLVTMTLVSYFSAFANEPVLSQSMALTRSLAPGW
jgi:alginate O-acetyltransferase complex protein AlgI